MFSARAACGSATAIATARAAVFAIRTIRVLSDVFFILFLFSNARDVFVGLVAWNAAHRRNHPFTKSACSIKRTRVKAGITRRSSRLPAPDLLFVRRSKDPEALARTEFETTALVHAQSLLRFALKMVRDHHRAEDLVQETLLSAWRHFHQFEPGTNCRAWLFRILINARNRDFNKRRDLAEVVSIDDVQLRDREKISVSAEINSALGSLSSEHREILILSVVEGFSIKELASILAVPAGTVMSRLSRARARLRELLSPAETMVGT
jgi:RNA polymerase sigma-70 factor (ECF subfamily)